MKIHRYPLRIYYEDTDAGGVVYYANYLRFAERGRTEAMREAGIPHDNLIREHGVSFMVRRVEVEYCRPARLDELVHVLTRVTAVGGASVRLRQDVVGGGDAVCVSLELRMACVAVATGRAAAMPARWRAVLSRMADGEAG